MKRKTIAAVWLCVVMMLGMFPVTPLVTAAPTLTDEYAPRKYVVGEAITAENKLREADELIRFTYGYDLKRAELWLYNSNASYKKRYDATGANHTCTNEWGVEVAVNKYGFATEKAINRGNMAIPEGGYVLSGHGTAGEELAKNIEIGDYVHINQGVYYVYRTTDDSKFTDASKMFEVSKSHIHQIVDGGNEVTNDTLWTSTFLCKATGTGADGVANHRGYVVDFGGKEIDPVPKGYFVIVMVSSPIDGDNNGVPHYNGARLLDDYAAVGATVNIGKDTVTFCHDTTSAKRAARLISGTTDAAVTSVYDYAASTILNDAKTKFELVDTARLQMLHDNIRSIADAVQSMNTIEDMEPYMATLYQNYREMQSLEIEKHPVEMRAAWWRPMHDNGALFTKEQLDKHIEENVAKFKRYGHNMLFVEGFYNSVTIFPVDPTQATYEGLCYQHNPCLVPQSMGGRNPYLTEPYDMLQRTIDICQQYDIECHLWWEVFYIGYELYNNTTDVDPLTEYGIGKTIRTDIEANGKNAKYYNWLNVAHDGSLVAGSAANGRETYWLNPAKQEVRDFLIHTVDYICKRYDIASFQIDYTRHPNDGIHEFGYDSETVEAFKRAYPAYRNTNLAAPSLWKNANWVQFRADTITEFVRQLHDFLEKNHPAVLLTCSPNPDINAALREGMQDVDAWLKNGYIDILFPMAYGYHIPGSTTKEWVERTAEHYVCTGLSVTYKNAELEADWIRQIREANAAGVATFNNIIPSYADDIWSKPAVTQTGDAAKAATVYLTDVVAKRADKMLELGAVDSATHAAVRSLVESAAFTVRVNGIESEAAMTALNALQAYANGLATDPKAALLDDVEYLLKIRSNSHDVARQEREKGNAGTVGGANYISGSDTLYITRNTTLEGNFAQKVTVLTAETVNRLELKDLAFVGSDGVAFEVLGDTLQLKLTGENTVTADVFSTVDVTYCGTGALYNDGVLQVQMGDVTEDGIFNSFDVRALLCDGIIFERLSEKQKAISDANGDGIVNTADIRMFLLAYAERP